MVGSSPFAHDDDDLAPSLFATVPSDARGDWIARYDLGYGFRV
jgi:hypothetical protein